jgi:hypothetical protein
VVLPRPISSPLETLMRLGGIEERAPSVVERYGAAASRLLAPLLMGASNGIEARLPYDLEWR